MRKNEMKEELERLFSRYIHRMNQAYRNYRETGNDFERGQQVAYDDITDDIVALLQRLGETHEPIE